MTILPSEGPSALGRCNCDSLCPKRNSNVDVMNRWSADEAVVIVKFGADEFMVTWRRDICAVTLARFTGEKGADISSQNIFWTTP